MKCGAKAYLDVRVAMRDGIELGTHIFLPDEDGPFPVMLMRNPYNALRRNDMVEWTKRGYAYVLQDVRGRFLSDGEFYPHFYEGKDAEDSLNWICKQSWCNGNIAMYGGSYKSATQIAAAKVGNPALKCFTPSCMNAEFYHGFYWGGALRLSWQTNWTVKPEDDADQNEIRYHLPLKDTDVLATGKQVPFWRDLLEHPQYDEYWQRISTANRFNKIQAPAFIRTGWFDLYVCDIFDLYNGIRKNGGSDEARNYTRIIVGPWPHSINKKDVGEKDYGTDYAIEDLFQQELEFIEYFTQGPNQYNIETAPVKLFIMGINKWRDEYEWPLARTVWTEKFLSSNANANTSSGDGTLVSEPSGSCDSFTYDPANPVPTKGGAWEFINMGSCDQAEVETRNDVLVYTSDELSDDLEVIGPIEVKLFASSSAVDTDFTAKLVDVDPDGKAMSVTDGIVSAHHLHSDGDGVPLVPGKVYEFIIKCNPTAYVFLKGHKLRLEISSSNFPAFARNLNTGEAIATGTEWCVAEQTVYHSKQYPSRIILPIIPK